MTTNSAILSAETELPVATGSGPGSGPGIGARVHKGLSNPVASIIAILIALLWTVPTFGLLVTSIRPVKDINTTGWWTWFTNFHFTWANYNAVLFGGNNSSAGNLASYVINSVVITIPAVLLPLALASFAAYALAWGSFPGRDWLYIGIFALQIVPLQMALIPLLQFFNTTLKIPTFGQLWFAHTCFALPIGVFLLHNFMSELPREVLEAARVDGAGHAQIFARVVLPLVVPALASFGIFQFLWVWNDYLVGLVFAGSGADAAPMTVRLAGLAGTRGADWQRLTAGAFVSMVIPLVVFLSLQRYFVRGLLAGSVKG
ncbi:MAG: alpha-glucoside transport system permease protein [Frankiaceae bacterium]|jgi:alpha-glucoside transport system permease protein|nr:alpha-glucoside transport system permease protein [Frankiaceae bacterium]